MPIRAESLHRLTLLGIVAGIALSLFAAWETLDPALSGVCSVNPLISCSAVDRSGLTTTLGIPDWAWGLGGFALMLGLDVVAFRTWRRPWVGAVALVAAGGVAFASYLAYVEVVQIGAICPVCFGSYAADAIVLASALTLWRRSAEDDRSGARAS